MAKTTKTERRALDTLDEAATVAQRAKKAAKRVDDKPAKKLRALAAEAKDVAETKKKKVRKHPKRFVAGATEVLERVSKATDKALRKAKDQARDAAKPVPLKRLEQKALEESVASVPPSREPEPGVAAVPAPAVTEPVSEAPDVETPTDAKAPAAAKDLSSLTVAQLRERARAEGRPGFSRLTKAQLIDLLA